MTTRFALPFALFVLTGCAASAAPPAPSDSSSHAAESKGGADEGQPPGATQGSVALVGATARYIGREGSSAKSLLIQIADGEASCSTDPAAGDHYFSLSIAGDAVAPGSFVVTSSSTLASAFFLQASGGGAVGSVDQATGGTIVLTNTSDTVSGTMDLDFADTHAAQPFDAIWCPDQLNQRVP